MTTTTEAGTEILKQDKMGRVRTTRERREALLQEYEGSGMSGMEFAAFVGVKYQTFATWVQKQRRGREASCPARAVQWVEAVVGAKAEGLVVELGVGARMEITDARTAGLAAEVLRHLGRLKGC